MAIDEATRHEIHESFKAQMGAKLAGALMELLPPVGWADVATKHDLEQLRVNLSEHFDARLAVATGGVHKEISAMATRLTTLMVTVLVAVVVALASMRFA